MSKLQENPSAFKKEHPALQNIKFLYFSNLIGLFALLDPDSESGSVSTDLIESGSGSETLLRQTELSFERILFILVLPFDSRDLLSIQFYCFQQLEL